MKRAIVAMIGLAALALPAAAEEDGTRVEIVAGSQFQDVSAGKPRDEGRDARLNEYLEIPEGTVIPLLRLWRGTPESAYLARLDGRNLLREDQSFTGLFERTGRARLGLTYTQIPHWWSRRSTLLLSEHSGLLTLSDELRQDLEAAATATPDSAMLANLPPALNRALASTAHETDLRIRRDARRLDGEVVVTPRWRVRGHAGLETRTGTRASSAGTYRRAGGADSLKFDRERFDVRGQEFPATVDYRTVGAGLSTDVRGRRGFVEAGVDLSFFRDELGGMQWENPLEAYPSAQSSSDRGRFARGQQALPPDNDFARARVAGSLKLGTKAQVSATVAASRWKQDEAFLPFTLNEALMFPGTDGTVGTADDVPGTSLSLLPAKSLDGEVRTRRADVRLTARPARKMTVEATGRFYGYDNKTPRLDFPGYAAYGESYFRRGVGIKEEGKDVLFNDPSEYTQRRFGVTAGYAVATPLHVSLGAERITWDYDGRQVDKTDEDVITARVRGEAPGGRGGWSAFFQNGSREHSGDYEVGLELSKNRMFDVWDRDRTRYGAEVDVELSERTVATLSGSRTSDDYPGAVEGATFGYGLQESETNEFGAWLNVRASERVSLFGGGGVDDSNWKSLLVTKTGFGHDSGPTQYDPKNRWFRDQDDQTVWGGAGVRATLVPGKWSAEASYNVNAYSGEVLTTNPETPTVNSAVAVPWSEIKTTWHEVRVGVDRTLSDRLGIGFRYTFLPFTIEDPAWNSLAPSMQGTITEVRASASDVRAGNAARYLFMDNRYGDTDAHIATLFVTAKLP